MLSGWSTAGLTINTISGYTIPYYLDTLTLTTEVDSKLLFMLELQNYISSGTTEIGLGINKQSTIDSYGFFDFNQAALPTTATIGNTWYPSANVIASFNSATAVNLATNTITTSSASFVTGQMVQYLPDPIVGGTPIGGLTFGTFSYKLGLDIGTPYYIIKLSDTSYRLASTYLNAMAVTPIPIDLTTLGTGTHSLVSVQTVGKPYIADYSMKFSCNGTSSGVNISTSTFTVTPSANSTLYTGQKIHYYGGLTDIDISPLVAGTDYYVVKLSSTTFKLATTYANAVAATPIVINITAVSTGTHLFQSDLNWYYDSASVETTDIQYITANTNQNTSTLIEYLTQSGGITESYNFYLFLNNPTKLSNLAFTTSFTILNGKR